MWDETVRAARLTAAAVAVALAAAGCSFSFGADYTGAAEDLIVEELERLELTNVVATCEEPANTDVGSTFTCTSTSDQGESSFLVTIEEEDTIVVDQVG